jgi:hypothetical protein
MNPPANNLVIRLGASNTTTKAKITPKITTPKASAAAKEEDVSTKARRQAHRQAEIEVEAVRNAYLMRTAKGITNWRQLQLAVDNLPIPASFLNGPLTYETVTNFTRFWLATTEQRLAAANAACERRETVTTERLSSDAPTAQLGNYKLMPEQLVASKRIMLAMLSGIKRVLQDAKGGAGKTFIAADVVQKFLASNLWQQHPILDTMPGRVIIITRKTIRTQYLNVLLNAGFGQDIASGRIIVTTYPQLSAEFGARYMTQRFDPVANDYVTSANPLMAPALVILDECHALNNPETKQTKFILAWQKLANAPYMLFMSATPFITINHARTFIVNSGLQHPSVGTITEANFKTFAGTFAKRPDKQNKKAAKRLRGWLLEHNRIVSLPHVKWDHKAINQVLIVDFDCDEDRQRYQQAFEIYCEAKRRIGESTDFGTFDKMVALGQFRKVAEPCRARPMARLIAKYHKDGYAPAIGCCFRETVSQLVNLLTSEHGFKRSDISIIYGGKRAWRKDLLLDEATFQDITVRSSQDPESVEDWEIRALRETVQYKTEQVRLGETEEEQLKRLAHMEELGLTGTQSAAARQMEIDNFQSGRSTICIFTLAAGGVGLSLDQDKPHLRPRVGFFTPSYSGPEFQQALFRLIRRCTLSDVMQFLVYLRGTIEETHVAPKVDANLKCLAAITGAQFSLLDLDTAPRHEAAKFRTIEEILADAESEEARVENIELIGDGDDDDDE